VKRHIALAAVMIMALVAAGDAQEQKPAVGTSVKLQLVLSRYQGEKKVSSLPYTLMVNMDERNRNTGRANLRLGTQVPITTMSRQGTDANAPMVPTVQYRDVGTSIDCVAVGLDEGRYRLEITIEDSSIDTGPGNSADMSHPTFRSFRTQDAVVLRDGQAAQSFTATDKVSGDVWKVDLTLSVVK